MAAFGSFESVKPQCDKIIRISKAARSCRVARVTNKSVIFCLPDQAASMPFAAALSEAGWTVQIRKGLTTDNCFINVYFNYPH